jgi:hypothetical protein
MKSDRLDAPRILRRPQRCPYCGRHRRVSAETFAQVPFCRRCLADRTAVAMARRGPVVRKRTGHYMATLLRGDDRSR